MTKDERRAYQRKYNSTPKMRKYFKDYQRKNRADILVKSRVRKMALKYEVLAHYGVNGEARCCWPGCNVEDLDMLSLDHVNNDGAQHRKTIKGAAGSLYYDVKSKGYPTGFQTLCYNHQWKKELERRRSL